MKFHRSIVPLAFSVALMSSSVPALATTQGHKAATAAEKSQSRAQFLSLWQSRSTAYSKDSALAASKRQAAASVLYGQPVFAFGANDRRLNRFLKASREASEAHRRHLVMSEFLAHISSSPEPAVTTAWLRAKVDELRRDVEAAEAAEARLKAAAKLQRTGVADMLKLFEAVSVAQGRAAGGTKEVQLLADNIRVFSGAEAGARTNRN